MKYSVETQLTPETLRTELDMNDRQRVNAMGVLPLLERLGLIAWYDAEQHGLLLGTAENGPIDESLPLWIQEGGETDNVVVMLRMLCVLRGVNPDEDRVATLEKRVAALEKELRQTKKKPSHSKKKASCRKKISDEGTAMEPEQPPSEAIEEPGEPESRSEQSDEPAAELADEPEQAAEPTLKKKPGRKPLAPGQVMVAYRELKPYFTEHGVEFEVDEEKQGVRYYDPHKSRCAHFYAACAKDLRKVRDLLRIIEKGAATEAA